MNKLMICAIVFFFMAAMFFIVSAIDFVHYLDELEKEKQQRLSSPGGFGGRAILTNHYFRIFVAYALGGVIAALIGLNLLLLDRRHDVT